jgi:hypothetical protein
MWNFVYSWTMIEFMGRKDHQFMRTKYIDLAQLNKGKPVERRGRKATGLIHENYSWDDSRAAL